MDVERSAIVRLPLRWAKEWARWDTWSSKPYRTGLGSYIPSNIIEETAKQMLLCFLLKMVILLLLFCTFPCLGVRRPGIKIKYKPTWLLHFTNIIPLDIAKLVTKFSYQHLQCSRTECPGFCSLHLIWKALRRNISSNPLGFFDIQMNRRWSRLPWWRKLCKLLRNKSKGAKQPEAEGIS